MSKNHTVNPLNAALTSGGAPPDPKLEAFESEVARLRLKLQSLQTNFAQACAKFA